MATEIQSSSILDFFRKPATSCALGFATLASLTFGASCSRHRALDPEDKHFSISSRAELTVSPQKLVAISSDTLVVENNCKGLEARVKVQNYVATPDSNQSFVLWVAPLIHDPQDSSRQIIDIQNAQAFGANPSDGCTAVVPDSAGFNGSCPREIGSLQGGGWILSGKYVVLATHSAAHLNECPNLGSSDEPNVVQIVEVELSGELPLGSPDPKPLSYFQSSNTQF